VKLAVASLFGLAVFCMGACGPAALQPAPQSGIVGKWRSADGSSAFEFSPTGNCSGRLRMQGRELGGPCKYSVDQDTITIRYYGPGASPQSGEPDTSTTWRYSLAGGVLNVSTGVVSLTLERVH
jgi:hypothetical protein